MENLQQHYNNFPQVKQKQKIDYFSQPIFYQILNFCELKDIAKCQQVCKEWDKWINNSYVFKKVKYGVEEQNQISDPKKHSEFINWLIKKIQNYQPEEMTILDYQDLWTFEQILMLVKYENENLKKVTLYFDREDFDNKILTQLLCTRCKNIENFKTHGKFFSDSNSKFLMENCKNLRQFSIENDDIGFEGVYLPEFPPLEKIFLRPHNIDFELLIKLIVKSCSILRKLGIDCEYFCQAQVEAILDYMYPDKIEVLYMYYCEEYDEKVLIDYICKFTNLKKLKFRKAINIDSDGIYMAAKNLQTSSLKLLDLTECSGLLDKSLELILQKNKNIEVLKLNWCSNLTNDSLYLIFENLKYLKHFEAQGLKQMGDKSFKQISDQLLPFFDKQQMKKSQNGQLVQFLNSNFSKQSNKEYYSEFAQVFFTKKIDFSRITHYQSLMFLDIQKSDYISDELQFILKLIRPYITIKNYYGEEVMIDCRYKSEMDDNEY